MGDHLTKTIIKLKEQGVISKEHAETVLRLAKQLETPEGKLVTKALRRVVVNAIADILNKIFSDR